jgi:phenylacetate-CoA ligase
MTQLDRTRHLIGELLEGNRFYAPRLKAAGLDPDLPDLATFTARMPFTTKAEVVADQRAHPPYGTNLTYPLERYVRFHQTSGTTGGAPLRWLDTAESWSGLLTVWQRVFAVAGIGPGSRVFLPFSFGPFLGFWTAFDAARRLGCLTLPGGGLSTLGRLRLIVDNRVDAVCCTPTYALHLGQTAQAEGIDLAAAGVRAVIVAGEAGGSVEATRREIERLWGGAGGEEGDGGGVRVYDHHGMTEVGPVSYPNPRFPGVLHILEESFLAEVLDPASGQPVAPGAVGELVLTTLGRVASPLLRYRTGDLVRPATRSAAELGFPDLALEGGILSRVDDMVVVRGVNLYPSAVEAVIRAQPGVAEYRVELAHRGALTEVRVIVEPTPDLAARAALPGQLETALRTAFQLRIPVHLAAEGALPRFEMKARRWQRGE